MRFIKFFQSILETFTFIRFNIQDLVKKPDQQFVKCVSSLLYKTEKPMRFWANDKAPKVKDIKGYNHALRKCWIIYGADSFWLDFPFYLINILRGSWFLCWELSLIPWLWFWLTPWSSHLVILNKEKSALYQLRWKMKKNYTLASKVRMPFLFEILTKNFVLCIKTHFDFSCLCVLYTEHRRIKTT